MSDSLPPHGPQHARLPCPSPSCSNLCPLSPIISSSVFPFSFCLQSFPAPGSFLRNWLFASGSQSIGASVSAVLPVNIQDWFPLGLTGLIFLKSKRLSRVFSNTTAEKHQFFGALPSLWSKSHIHTWVRVSEVTQSCPTLCDPIDCSLPGSSVHGIFQAIVLEWIAISFSMGSSQPRARTQVSNTIDRCFTVWAKMGHR